MTELTYKDVLPHLPMGRKSIKKFPIFDFANPPTDPVQLAQDMIGFLEMIKLDSVSGVHLGYNYRVVAIRSGKENENDPDFYVMFNPMIVHLSEKKSIGLEADCSFPGIAATIERPAEVRLRFQTTTSQIMTKKLTGTTARLFLHENDRLEGKLFWHSLPLSKKNQLNNKLIKLERATK